jgi:hypothetical protein
MHRLVIDYHLLGLHPDSWRLVRNAPHSGRMRGRLVSQLELVPDHGLQERGTS